MGNSSVILPQQTQILALAMLLASPNSGASIAPNIGPILPTGSFTQPPNDFAGLFFAGLFDNNVPAQQPAEDPYAALAFAALLNHGQSAQAASSSQDDAFAAFAAALLKRQKPQCCPIGVGAGMKGRFWGDPHFESMKDGKKYDLHPAQGTTVNVFSDKDLQMNCKADKWKDDPTATVFTDMGLQLGGYRLKFGINDDAPILMFNDGRSVPLQDGVEVDLGCAKVKWNKATNKLEFENNEYKGVCEKVADGYLNVDVQVTEQGYLSDCVEPEGLLGRSVKGDISDNVDCKTGAGALGIDPTTGQPRTFDNYTIANGDLFGVANDPSVRRFDPGNVITGGPGTYPGSILEPDWCNPNESCGTWGSPSPIGGGNPWAISNNPIAQLLNIIKLLLGSFQHVF